MKNILFKITFIIPCAVLLLSTCTRDDIFEKEDTETETETESGTTVLDNVENISGHDAESDYIWDAADVTNITLNGNSITVDGDGTQVEGSIATISTAGTYSASGNLSNGQIIVDTEAEDALVRLILNGIDITCANNAPIYIKNAEKVILILADDTENDVTDGSSYSSSEEDANAAIFSKQNLTIYGNGSLNVSGKYNDGITGKDGLIIASGNITVNAVDDGIRGKDYLIIKNGNITVDAVGDGLKSDNDEDSGTGFISIENGAIDITASGDGLQASQDILVYDGEINVISDGGSSKSVASDASAKGLKSGISIITYGGSISVNSADDAIHTDGTMQAYNGTFELASGDDGIHTESDLTFVLGNVNITKSYEGLESSTGSIYIEGGDFYIVASDDGINISAGGASQGGGHRQKSATVSGQYALDISGGYIYINCEGDGLDSNDLLAISGGTQIVNSAEYNENSALDYDGSCVVDGGFVLAIGSSRMSQAPSSSSSQYSFLIDFSSRISAGKFINIQDSNGLDILTYKTLKSISSIAFSSSDLQKGMTYSVYVGGSSTGTNKDGLYTGGTYSGGTKYGSISLTSIVSKTNL